MAEAEEGMAEAGERMGEARSAETFNSLATIRDGYSDLVHSESIADG